MAKSESLPWMLGELSNVRDGMLRSRRLSIEAQEHCQAPIVPELDCHVRRAETLIMRIILPPCRHAFTTRLTNLTCLDDPPSKAACHIRRMKMRACINGDMLNCGTAVSMPDFFSVFA